MTGAASRASARATARAPARSRAESGSISGACGIDGTNGSLHVDVGRLHALDARPLHVLPRLGERAVDVDATARILDHQRGEARLSRVERRPGHAEICGKTDQEHLVEIPLPQIAGQSCRGLAVRLEEGGVRIHLLAVTLADDQLGVRNLEVLVQGRAVRALDAVIGPQHLSPVREAGCLERLLPRVTRRERDVAGRMPVLGEDHVREAGGEPIDDRDDLIAVLHGQRASRREAVLDVDDEEDVLLPRLDLRLRVCAPGELCEGGGEETSRCALEKRAAIVAHTCLLMLDERLAGLCEQYSAEIPEQPPRHRIPTRLNASLDHARTWSTMWSLDGACPAGAERTDRP